MEPRGYIFVEIEVGKIWRSIEIGKISVLNVAERLSAYAERNLR